MRVGWGEQGKRTKDKGKSDREMLAMPSEPARFLHVANGTSTTRTIEESRIPGVTSIWADVLHEGPVPDGLSDDELLNLRARVLADGVEESVDDVAAGLNRWRTIIDNDEAYDELVLWYEHDLFDQLNLIQLLSWIGRQLPTTRPVSLICIGSFPGRERFKGLGELTPAELATLFDTREHVHDRQYALAQRAWQAFRAPDPRQIEELMHGDTSALPFLAPALRRYLEEFPWTLDGLSRSERRLLELAVNGSIDLWAAFPRMHDLENAFYIADGSFWNVAETLASASPPLISMTITSRAARGLPRGTVSTTDTGRAVLARDLDRIRSCGVDRWLGGVHLQGSGPLWRWNETEGRIVKR
jgi:hypothetical protein